MMVHTITIVCELMHGIVTPDVWAVDSSQPYTLVYRVMTWIGLRMSVRFGIIMYTPLL